MKKGLGQAETRLFAYVQMRGLHTVRTGQLTKPLQLSAIQERKLLSGLAKAGLIARVWRGLYLVPSKLPLGGKWNPDEILALNTLIKAQGGDYQICGPTLSTATDRSPANGNISPSGSATTKRKRDE